MPASVVPVLLGELWQVELPILHINHPLQPVLVLLKQEHVQMEVCPEVIQRQVVLLAVPALHGVLL